MGVGNRRDAERKNQVSNNTRYQSPGVVNTNPQRQQGPAFCEAARWRFFVAADVTNACHRSLAHVEPSASVLGVFVEQAAWV